MPEHYLCVHCHFYQPPRGNPFGADEPGSEPGAEPYRNFNEKIAKECYAPNAALDNYELMSFDMGTTLLQWLERHEPDTYARILAADRANRDRQGVGNAVAMPVHHTILPLHRKRDKALQVRWGQISFEGRFGRPAEGMWLPEMAVDLETLQVLHEAGIQFIILSQGQVRGADQGAGPYWVQLPSGDRLAAYIRDDWHSNQIAFAVHSFGGAGRWARSTLAPLRRDYGRLLLVATVGETFGYHYPGEEHFLHWLLEYEADSVGFQVTTLTRDLRAHPPSAEIEITEYTSWSCPHRLARWSTGCECTPGDARWKAALRRALDNVAKEVDEALLEFGRRLGLDPWPLCLEFMRLHLGQVTEADFLRDAALERLSVEDARTLFDLLWAQFYRQRMYNSSAFFHGDLDRPEPRYALGNAVRAIRLAAGASAAEWMASLRRDLSPAASARSGQTGPQILDEVLALAQESAPQ